MRGIPGRTHDGANLTVVACLCWVGVVHADPAKASEWNGNKPVAGHLSLRASGLPTAIISPEAAIQIPAELERFVEQDTVPVELEGADLNGDGREDYLLVLDTGVGLARTLLILLRQSDGSLALRERSTSLIECDMCGGTHGGFEGIKAFRERFEITNSRGDARLYMATRCAFRYLHREHTWQLTKVVEEWRWVSEDGTFGRSSKTRTRKDFGLIKLSEVQEGMCGGGGAE